tara:strand:- start:3970 stop:4734 length:765 start_codon:yes stop_codon:yes gene_type:complete
MASIKSIVKYWTSHEGFERIEEIEQDLNIDLGDFKRTLIKCRDLKESRCWACTAKLSSVPMYEEAYTGIERCHIIPKMIGGPDEAHNLILMCRRCHKASPTTPRKEVLWKWLEGALERQSKHIREAWEQTSSCIRKRLISTVIDLQNESPEAPKFIDDCCAFMEHHEEFFNFKEIESSLQKLLFRPDRHVQDAWVWKEYLMQLAIKLDERVRDVLKTQTEEALKKAEQALASAELRKINQETTCYEQGDQMELF